MNDTTHQRNALVELDYRCDLCGLVVADGEGSVYVRQDDLQQIITSVPVPSSTATRLSVADFLTSPVPATWRIHHDTCRPAEDTEGYDIAVDQIRTWRALLNWTVHLMDKSWLASTNWRTVLRNALDELDQRIIPAHAHGDAA